MKVRFVVEMMNLGRLMMMMKVYGIILVIWR